MRAAGINWKKAGLTVVLLALAACVLIMIGRIPDQAGPARESAAARRTYYAAALIVTGLSLVLLWGWGRKWSQRKAVLMILVQCLVYMLLFPAWNINDFHMHFMTSYDYTNVLLGVKADPEGFLMVREGDVNLFTDVLQDPDQPFFQPTRRSYADAAAYLFRPLEGGGQPVPFTGYSATHREFGPWSYAPYILGILIARLLSLNLVTAIFLARLCGVACWVTVIALALRKMPDILTVPVTVLSCVPMCAMNLTAVSYDPPCYVAALYFFACVTALRRRYRRGDAVSLIACSLALGLVKRGAYAPFILALGLLFFRKDRALRRLAILSAGAALLGMVINYRGALFGGAGVSALSAKAADTYDAGWALSHPLDYLVLMVRTYLRQPEKIWSVVGMHLGWNRAAVPEIVCALFYVLLGLSAMLPAGEGDGILPFTGFERIWIWLPVGLMILYLPVTMLGYTFITWDTIDTPQGRYYLPLLIPLLTLWRHNPPKRLRFTGSDPTLLLWGTGLLTLASVYYIGVTFLAL